MSELNLDRCWICGAEEKLARRTLRLTSEGGEAREVGVATCFRCRAQMHHAKDAQDVALATISPKERVIRAFDVAGVPFIIGLGCLVSAAAGWVSPVFYVLGGLLILLLAPAFAALQYRRSGIHHASREQRWVASSEHAEREELTQRVAAKWAELKAHLASQGLQLQTDLEEEELVHPKTWSAV